MLPMLLFAVWLIYSTYQRDREVAFDRVLEAVRSMRIVLDSEMSNISTGLRVLSLTQALQRDDLSGFRSNAEAFVGIYGEESALVLADRKGQQLINTRVPPGTQLPRRQNTTGTDAVFEKRTPVFSRLFVGSVLKKPIITIDFPVIRDGEVIYVLSFNPPMSMFQRIVERQRPSDEWTISIFDQDGVNFARVPNPEQTIGQKASSTLYNELFKSDEAKIATVSLEGVPLLTAFTRSHLTGWTVAAGVASATLTAPLYRALAITTATGAVLLAIGLGFAVRMATRIARAENMHALLVSELSHRVKNTLVTVQSIALQTFHPNADLGESRQKFSERLAALGRAHSLLRDEKWEGLICMELRKVSWSPTRLSRAV